MKTAEDFINIYNEKNNTQYSKYDCNTKMMIEFAKYHLEKTITEIILNSEIRFSPRDEESWNQKSIEKEDILDFYDDSTNDIDFQYEQLRDRDGFTIEIDEESIRKAYPLENIK